MSDPIQNPGSLNPSTPATTPPASGSDLPTERAEQDQRIANDLGTALKVLQAVKENAEIAALMADKGYAAADVAEGLVLLEAAQTAYAERQGKLAAQKAATAASVGAVAQARETLMAFRKLARATHPSAADRTALGLNGTAPRDLEKFETVARSSYKAAAKAPYAAKLAKRGFGAQALADAVQGLEAMVQTAEQQATAAAQAQAATAARDAAHRTLMEWLREMRSVADVALAKKPALLRMLRA